MPIHSQGYRRREAGAATGRAFRGAPIAWLTLRQILARRALVAALALLVAPLLLEAAVLLVLGRFPDLAAVLPPVKELFGIALLVQMSFAVLVSVWAGTGLVADDFRTGALLVYFSRPLTRADYIAGKLAVIVALNFAVTALPLLLLWALAMALDRREGLAFVPVAIVVSSLLASLVLSAAAMAAGAVTRNGALGAALLAAGLVAFDVAAAVAPAGAALPLKMLALRRHAVSLTHALFGVVPGPAELHWAVALGCLLAIVAAAGVLVWRRLQAVEVVS